jgi:hypothetical protein
MTWKHIVLGVAGFAIGFWACMPREAVLQPRWEVLVVNDVGNGLAGARVRDMWQDYITDRGDGESDQVADSYGRAAFPAVRVRTSPLLRAIACGKQIASQGAHAGCGYYQDIVAEVDGYAEAARSVSDLPVKSRGKLLTITLRPAR